MLEHAFLIILSTAFVNNFVLVNFLGLCPVMGVTKKLSSAISMAMATTFVLVLTACISYLINTYLLVPFNLTYLRIICFILSIASAVQLTEILIKSISPLLHQVLGIYLPLITTNCAVLGLALLNTNQHHRLADSLLYGFGAALGFSIVLLLFASLRERLSQSAIPKPFQGTPIALITAGLLSLAFMGFSGLVRVS